MHQSSPERNTIQATMNVRRAILFCSVTVLGAVALTVLAAFVAPGLLLDLMEVNSSRGRVARCQTVANFRATSNATSAMTWPAVPTTRQPSMAQAPLLQVRFGDKRRQHRIARDCRRFASSVERQS